MQLGNQVAFQYKLVLGMIVQCTMCTVQFDQSLILFLFFTHLESTMACLLSPTVGMSNSIDLFYLPSRTDQCNALQGTLI